MVGLRENLDLLSKISRQQSLISHVIYKKIVNAVGHEFGEGEPNGALTIRKEDISSTFRGFLPTMLFFLAIIVLWQITVDLLRIPHYIIPSPYRIFQALISQDAARFLYHCSVTLEEIVLGFVIGCSAGILIGISIAYSGILEKTLYPVAIAVKVTPVVAVAPLIVIWFGPYVLSKVVIVAMISFFFPVVNTVLGLKSVDPMLIDLMRSISATEWRIFVKVKFPATLPYIFSALKVSITAAVIGAVVGEFVGAVSGLGFLILVAASSVDSPEMFAIILTLAVLGIILFACVSLLERILIPWAGQQTKVVTA